MINKLIFSMILGLALTAARASAATSPNDVRGFVYEWFGLFDRNAAAEEFLARLAPEDLSVAFPEETLRSHADFTNWYAGIVATFATATHDVKTLTVQDLGQDWQVDLTVLWQAKKFDGSPAGGLFHQVWQVEESNEGRLVIKRNVITPVTSTALYHRVNSLDEVSPGMDYQLRQPVVESPTQLQGKRIALLAAPGAEEEEILFPIDYFQARGATVDVVGPAWANGKLLAVSFTKPSYWVTVTKTFEQALQETYDVVIVTGGPWNSGILRNDANALALVKRQLAEGRLLAPVCSGSQVLIDAGLALGREVTGAPNVRIDLVNAGATYLDQPVVEAGNLITGQDPRAMVAFVQTLGQRLLGR